MHTTVVAESPNLNRSVALAPCGDAAVSKALAIRTSRGPGTPVFQAAGVPPYRKGVASLGLAARNARNGAHVGAFRVEAHPQLHRGVVETQRESTPHPSAPAQIAARCIQATRSLADLSCGGNYFAALCRSSLLSGGRHSDPRAGADYIRPPMTLLLLLILVVLIRLHLDGGL